MLVDLEVRLHSFQRGLVITGSPLLESERRIRVNRNFKAPNPEMF